MTEPQERRDGLVAEKEELEIRKTELESVLDLEQAANKKLRKKFKKLMKKKKKLELALEILASDSD